MKLRLLAPALAALGLSSAHAQITVDDTATFTTSPNGALQRPSPYTFQVDGVFDPNLQARTIPGALSDFDPTGSDKLIVAFGSEGAGSVVSITYGGVSMSPAVVANNGGQFTGIYYLDNPTVVGDLVLTFSGSSSNGVGGSLMAVSSSRLGPPVVTASDPGQSTDITTADANSLIVAAHANNGGSGTAQSPFTALFDGSVGSGGGGTGYLDQPAIGTVTARFTGSTNNPVTAAAAFAPTQPRNPAPNGGIVPGGEVPLTWQNLAPNSGSDVWVDVWFGSDPDNLTQVVSADPDGLNLTAFTTDSLLAGTYYWRVDSYLDGAPAGTPVTGTLLTFTIIDTDSDGLPDDWEEQFSDPSSPTALNPGDDLDGDTLTNLEEFELGTDPTKADTDDDGLDDNVETNTGTFVDASGTGTDPLNSDTDGDGLLDGVETNTGTFVSAADTGTDPLDADSDADGLSDGVETDTGTFVGTSDTGTDPHDTDSDGDGAGDWYEVTAVFTDPNDADDTPGVPYPLPDPDPADTGDAAKPVKVYIMSGQSNTVGIGYINGTDPGSLDSVTQRENKFPNLIDGSANYTERNDVIYKGVVTATAEGPLTAGQGADSTRIGPELGFGHVMGWFHDEPVLIIKASQGNRSLGWDFLPPGSERFEVGELTYAGYGDRPQSWLTASEGPVPGTWYAGKQYDDCLLAESEMGMTPWEPSFDYVNNNTKVIHNGVPYTATTPHTSDPATEPGVGADWETVWSEYSIFNAHDVLGGDGTLQNLPADGNDLNGRSYEIAGFCWWQGHKDGGEQGTGTAGVYATRYEQNLVSLIDAMRADFNAPDAPVVVASIGFGGGEWDPGSSGDTIFNAQMAVGDPAQYPEFDGTVGSVDTTGYWREVSESPGGQGFHYNNNAETYMLVGDAMGRAMVELQEDEAPPAPNPSSFLIEPGPAGSGSVGMVAIAAGDVSGPVEYFFENLTNGDTSGWIPDNEWINTGLTDGVSQTYRVRTRDALGNTGDWSAEASAVAGADTTAPSPDPMTFASPPVALGETEITMTATAALDLNGVEYFFENTAGGGTDSGWQASPDFTATGLAPGTEYTYVVRARDKSAAQNTTADSAPATATTDAPDTSPPSPDPMTFATPPVATGPTAITMTATTASDDSGVEYFFEAVTGGGSDSGWQDGPSYTDSGLTPETTYSYRVRARDKSPNQNETGWSATLEATTTSSLTQIAVLNKGSFSTTASYPITAAAGLDASAASKIVFTLSDEDGFGDGAVSDVTFDGTPLQLAVSGANSIQQVAIYYLDATTVGGSFGTGDLVINGSGSNDLGGSWLVLSGTADGAGPDAFATAQSVDLTTLVGGSFVVAAHANNNSGATAQAPLTPLLDASVGSAGGGSGYATIDTAGPGTYPFTGGSSRPATAAVAFEPGAGTGVGSPFDDWADTFPGLTDPDPALDFDGGGLATALEWVLGGDPAAADDDAGLLPTLDNTGNADGKLLFIFRRAAAADEDAGTAIAVEYGSDLTGWTPVVHEGTGPGDITISEQADGFGPGIDRVTAALPSGLAADGKLFARLGVTIE